MTHHTDRRNGKYRMYTTISDTYYTPPLSESEFKQWIEDCNKHTPDGQRKIADFEKLVVHDVEWWVPEMCGYVYDCPVPDEHKNCVFACKAIVSCDKCGEDVERGDIYNHDCDEALNG